MEERIFIKGEDHDIPMILTLPDECIEKFPLMLLLHGFMATKEGDGYLFQKVAEKLKEKGIASARIDFCSMGENRASRRKYGLRELLKETKIAYQFLSENPKVDKQRIGLLGHSLGGRVALLSSGLNPKCIVTFNGAVQDMTSEEMSKLFNYDEVCEQGYTLIETSDGRTELIFSKYIEDMKAYSHVDISDYHGDLLQCVAEEDPSLNPQFNYDFYDCCSLENKEMIRIADANHTFNAKTGNYEKVYELMKKVNAWLCDHL